ncbi:MAG: 3-deoxy-manno-octulosonate cytidylyltransferase [Xanthomonadales bacterium]|nr:3-deoxy-manno-octulosonate cytidylyltransferase [Xanthomonadales bacterium]
MSRDYGFSVVIPARHASVRLPGKVLIDLDGKTLLQHVWERAGRSGAENVVIATDDARIEAAARDFGADVERTDPNHPSGSDRIAEVALKRKWSPERVIVNLQGDEPLMPAACLDQVAKLLLSRDDADAASLYWPITEAAEVSNPNAVKVVLTAAGEALLFSRSPIPYARDHADIAAALQAGVRWRRHLGLYAYRVESLLRFTRMRPGELEQAEHLEQLRYLEAGGTIVLEQACMPIPAGVDTPEDLERVRSIISKENNVI